MLDFHRCIQSPAFISPSPAPPFHLFIEPPSPCASRSHTPPSVSSFYVDPSHPSAHPSLKRSPPPSVSSFQTHSPLLPTPPSVSSFIFQTHSSSSPFSLFIPPTPACSSDLEESADFRLFIPNPFPPSPHFCFIHPASAWFPHPEGDSSSGGRILLDASRIKEREKWLRWINDGFGDVEGNGGIQEAERGLDLERREATADTIMRGRAEAPDQWGGRQGRDGRGSRGWRYGGGRPAAKVGHDGEGEGEAAALWRGKGRERQEEERKNEVWIRKTWEHFGSTHWKTWPPHLPHNTDSNSVSANLIVGTEGK